MKQSVQICTHQNNRMIDVNFVTKQKLSSQLGVSVRTIFNYHDCAMLHIDDFEIDYPNDGDVYYTNKGMSLYQCWVIKELMEIGNNYPKKIIPNLIKNGFVKLSKNDFINTVESNSNQCTAIVLAA